MPDRDHGPHESGLSCIHAARGLCPACRAAYEEDESAWHEFGDHPAGIARWREEQRLWAEYEAERRGTEAAPAADDSEIPY
jgi:hypothetical protein